MISQYEKKKVDKFFTENIDYLISFAKKRGIDEDIVHNVYLHIINMDENKGFQIERGKFIGYVCNAIVTKNIDNAELMQNKNLVLQDKYSNTDELELFNNDITFEETLKTHEQYTMLMRKIFVGLDSYVQQNVISENDIAMFKLYYINGYKCKDIGKMFDLTGRKVSNRNCLVKSLIVKLLE